MSKKSANYYVYEDKTTEKKALITVYVREKKRLSKNYYICREKKGLSKKLLITMYIGQKRDQVKKVLLSMYTRQEGTG